MTATTVGFAVAERDRALLDELVEYFGEGNRSEYLRASLKIMKSVKLAEELRELQAYGEERLKATGHTLDEIPELTRKTMKGATCSPC